MALLSQTWKVFGALLLAVAFVVGAFFAGGGGALAPSRVEASTETALLQAIATKDSDGDGLSDWEETLYKTDPHIVDTRGLGVTDGEAVAQGLIIPKAIADVPATVSGGQEAPAASLGFASPAEGSLTEVFSKHFFALYLSAKQQAGGTTLSKDQIAALITKALDAFLENLAVAPDFRTALQIQVLGRGPDALRAYAAQIDTVLSTHGSQLPKSELEYLQDAMNGDISAHNSIMTIATAYRETSEGLAALIVPQEVATTHLALVNAMARIGLIAIDFEKVKTDPLITMLAIKQYGPAVEALAQALISSGTIFKTQNIVLAPGTPGSAFLNIIPDVRERQSASGGVSRP